MLVPETFLTALAFQVLLGGVHEVYSQSECNLGEFLPRLPPVIRDGLFRYYLRVASGEAVLYDSDASERYKFPPPLMTSL